MGAQQDSVRRHRLRTATAVGCAVLVALAGALVAAPAHAAEPAGACSTTTGDLPGGVVLSGSRLTIGLLGCATTGSTPAASSAAPVAATDPVPPAAPVDLGPAGSSPTAPADAQSVSPQSTSTAPAIVVHRSSPTVYPVQDGYLDVVRFSVRETGADGSCVPLDGTAVLRRGSRVVRTWHLGGMRSVIAWNGRIGARIRPGVYTLHVALRTPDGGERSEETTVRVMAQHLTRRTLTIRTDVGATATSAALPKELIGAYRLGGVSIATRTVAQVRGKAELVFGGDGHRKAVRLRDGVHTTRPVALPRGFERVTIRHAWKRGAARLQSLQAIWTYSVLE